MNYRFKENSRFASLIGESKREDVRREDVKREDVKREEKSNSFKKSSPKEYSSFNRRERYNENYEKQERIKKEEEERRLEKEKKNALSIESFPELVKVNNPNKILIIENTSSFIETLKKVDKKVLEAESEKKIVQPGWIILTRDIATNQTIMNISKKYENDYVKTDKDLAYDVVDQLVYLHEKRTTEYIDSWGEDEWEKMFQFQNYDYHYFDKLDEIYEKKNAENNNDFNHQGEEEDEYWKKY